MKNSINAFDVEDFVVIAMTLASMTEIKKLLKKLNLKNMLVNKMLKI